jgi:hypothetical protein
VGNLRVAAAMVCVGALVWWAAFLVPLTSHGTDTQPGRLGAVLVAKCGATSGDLANVDWLVYRFGRTGRYPYGVIPAVGGGFAPVFGPGPAWLGAPFMTALPDPPRTFRDDREVRERARQAAALAVALAAALMVLAAAATTDVKHAALTGLVCAISFSGVAILAQALWQQTAMLPFFAGALAALAWQERWSWSTALFPPLIVVAVLVRPVIAPIALGLGICWLDRLRASPRQHAGKVIVGVLLAVLAALPFLAWNLRFLGTVLPVGQLRTNVGASDAMVFTFAHPGLYLEGLAGILVSPARGLLWWAPLALVGIAVALRSERRDARIVAVTLLANLLFLAGFFKWWGGVGNGPRLFTETLWVSAWLTLSRVARSSPRLVAVAAATTLFVGVLSSIAYSPMKWEIPANVDQHPGRLWNVVDSPLVGMMGPKPMMSAMDGWKGPFQCKDGRLVTIPEDSSGEGRFY